MKRIKRWLIKVLWNFLGISEQIIVIQYADAIPFNQLVTASFNPEIQLKRKSDEITRNILREALKYIEIEKYDNKEMNATCIKGRLFLFRQRRRNDKV